VQISPLPIVSRHSVFSKLFRLYNIWNLREQCTGWYGGLIGWRVWHDANGNDNPFDTLNFEKDMRGILCYVKIFCLGW
jgi:hypothetical protein